MRIASSALVLFAAAVNLIPVSGAASAARLQMLYGVTIADPNLQILLQHRAILFAIVGGMLFVSAFVRRLRAVASFAGLVSMLSFVAVAFAVGDYNDSLRRVLIADVAASAALAAAIALDRLGAARSR